MFIPPSNNNVGWKLSQMFSELPDTSDASSASSPLAPINSLLPKELLLRVFSFLDVVSLCRSAGITWLVSILSQSQ